MMRASFVTDILAKMALMLDTYVDLGIETLELGCNNRSKAPHVDLD
jgi:hypothetical protein